MGEKDQRTCEDLLLVSSCQSSQGASFLCLDRRVWDSGNWNIKYTLCVKSKHYKLFEFKKAVSYVYDNLFANLHMLN